MDAFESLIRRATDLYTLPSVAVELLRLTNEPEVDARAIKDCIERDPAMVVKILKVVNSSLFGMSREVADLNQALALLGTKTLKLLVLGFNLPDEMFNDVAAEQLARYWSVALTRAVAAREIAKTLWGSDGDDAFIAGLLEDIGMLLLLKELGEPYARLVDGVWREEGDLLHVERAALGFDHRQLSTALLGHWGLPQIVLDAVGAKRDSARLARLDRPHAELSQILHLASLMTELVGRRRLCVLPDLLETGNEYIGLTKPRLDEIVARLEPRVRSLADVLSLGLPDDLGFDQVIHNAHRRLAAVAEDVSIPIARLERCEQQLGEQLLEETRDLAEASSKFLSASSGTADPRSGTETTGGADLRFHAPSRSLPAENEQFDPLHQALETAVYRARIQREALSLALLQGRDDRQGFETDGSGNANADRALDAVGRALSAEGAQVVLGDGDGTRRAVVLPRRDRSAAVEAVNHAMREAIVVMAARGESANPPALFAGIASIAVISKNFEAQRLADSAERCLYAAGQGMPGGIKSIELY